MLKLETGLADAQLDRVAMRDPKNRDNLMSVAELKQLAPAFEFDAYFPATGAPRFEKLNVTSRKFFEQSSRLVAETPLADWKTYLRWHTVRTAAPYLGQAFVQRGLRLQPRSSCRGRRRSSRAGSAACRRPTAPSARRSGRSTSRRRSAPTARPA